MKSETYQYTLYATDSGQLPAAMSCLNHGQKSINI